MKQMLKVFSVTCFIMFVGGYALAGKSLHIEVTDLKSGKVKTEISVPFWLLHTGVKMNNVLGGNASQVNVAAIVKEIEQAGFKESKKGPFLTVKDYEKSEKVSLSVH